MGRFLPVTLIVLLMAGLAVADKDAPEPRVIKVTAVDMFKEFQKDTDAAARKYLPPKEGTPGVLIDITGVVDKVDGKAVEVALKTGANGYVVLHAKNIEGINAGARVQARGTFRNYFKNIVLIDCNQVKRAD